MEELILALFTLAFYVGIYVVLGYCGYKMAESRGRNKVWGAVSSVLFGLLAILVYYIIGDTEVKKAERIKNVMNMGTGEVVSASTDQRT